MMSERGGGGRERCEREISLFMHRQSVWDRYQSDVKIVTTCDTCWIGREANGPCGCPDAEPVYTSSSESFFKQVWAVHFTDVRIRKHMRFAKCEFCVKWRAVKGNRTATRLERDNAKRCLDGHYNWVGRERAEEVNKVILISSSHTPFR